MRPLPWVVVAVVVAMVAVAGAAPPPSPPEGGPVDHGWLPGPSGAAFAAFEGEPPPGGGPVWPGVMLESRRTSLPDGKGVDVMILHLEPGADVQVRPTLAGGSVHGTATVAQQSGDPLAGAVAALNGGFWLSKPWGEPNGYFAVDGRLVSDAETQGAGPRGTVGWTADGRVLIDRLDTVETLALADGTEVRVDGINRIRREYDELFADGIHSTLAYTGDFGRPVRLTQPAQPQPEPTPAPTPSDGAQPPSPPLPGEPSEPPPPDPVDLAAVRIALPWWPASGPWHGTVVGISRDAEATFEVGFGEVLVLATGDEAVALDGVVEGDVVIASTEVRPADPSQAAAWTEVTHGLAAGPRVVADGRVTDPGDWVDEGFEPAVHSDVRAPRSAIGVTADGRLLMVTADGRRPGVTHGFTIPELGEYMIALGAVDALSLDGGGSSQLVVDGILRNVPCCDNQTRPVATSLQLRHGQTFSATSRLAGAGRVDTAAAIAAASHPDGVETVVIATSNGFADALAGGPLASALGAPLLLTGRDGLPSVTRAAIAGLGAGRVVLLGGTAAISEAVAEEARDLGLAVERVAGDSRFDTAAAIAERIAAVTGGPARGAFVVPAGTFPDALIAAGPGGRLGMPVVLTDPASLHPAARAVLGGADEVVIVDGAGTFSADVEAQIQQLGGAVTTFVGGGRYAVSARVNDWLAQRASVSGELVVARGDAFPDALAGGPLAASRGARLVLVPPGSIDADPALAAWLANVAGSVDRAVLLGGLAALGSYHQWQLEELAAT